MANNHVYPLIFELGKKSVQSGRGKPSRFNNSIALVGIEISSFRVPDFVSIPRVHPDETIDSVLAAQHASVSIRAPNIIKARLSDGPACVRQDVLPASRSNSMKIGTTRCRVMS